MHYVCKEEGCYSGCCCWCRSLGRLCNPEEAIQVELPDSQEDGAQEEAQCSTCGRTTSMECHQPTATQGTQTIDTEGLKGLQGRRKAKTHFLVILSGIVSSFLCGCQKCYI